MLRFSEEQLAEFEKRRKQWEADGLVVAVRTHKLPDNQPLPKPKRGAIPQPPAEKRGVPIGVGTPKVGRPRQASDIEILLAEQLALLPAIPAPQREYKHLNDRKFRLDFAWPERKIAIEVQGMVHRIKGRFKNDIEKRALSMLHGWRILEVGGAEIRSGLAVRWFETLWSQP